MPFIPQASSAAGRVDAVFLFIFVLSAIFLLFITATLIWFVIRYNRKRHPRGEDIEGNVWLEIAWTAIPTVIFLAMFLYGWTNYSYMREVPRDAMVIETTGRQWAWSFRYPNGKRTSHLLLAADRPVKLELHSLDVIHGFFIAAFRIKQDVVPGKVNYTWFVPTQLGAFDIECTVICGVSHAIMNAKAVVVPVADFEAWYFGAEDDIPARFLKPASPAPAPAPESALDLLNRKSCTACHSVDGSPMVGPTLKGIYGRQGTVSDPDGRERTVTVDDDYLTRAIVNPAAEITRGYPPAMPETVMTDDELRRMVDFIRSLR